MMAIINKCLSINQNQQLLTEQNETSELGGLESLTKQFTLSMSCTYQRMINQGWIEDPN